MSSNGGNRQDDDRYKRRQQLLNQIRCQRYRDKKKKEAEAANSNISKHPTSTVEDEGKNKCKEHKKHLRKYSDKIKAINSSNLQIDQYLETLGKDVSKCQNFHNSQIAGPSSRNMSCVQPNHNRDLSTENKPYIPESQSDYDNSIHNEVYIIPHFIEPIITISNTENILPSDVPNNTQLEMSLEFVKIERLDNDDGEDFSYDDTSHNEIDIIDNKKLLNKISCQQYRDKKKDEVNSQMSKCQSTTAEDEEKIKRRKEQNKQKSKRYRDKQRAAKLINLQTDHSSKQVIRCKDFKKLL